VLAKALLGDPKGIDGERLKFATRNMVTSAGTLRPDDLLPLPSWVPRPISPKGSRALKRLKNAADDLIAERKINPVEDDLVSLLIAARDPKTGEGLSAREQRDNLIGFFIAGHETTALTLTWALYLIGMHRPTAERIRAEVLEVCGPDGNVAYEQMTELKFTPTMEAVMSLARLVRDYDVEVPEDCYPKPLMTVTLRPEGGVPARMVRRR